MWLSPLLSPILPTHTHTHTHKHSSSSAVYPSLWRLERRLAFWLYLIQLSKAGSSSVSTIPKTGEVCVCVLHWWVSVSFWTSHPVCNCRQSCTVLSHCVAVIFSSWRDTSFASRSPLLSSPCKCCGCLSLITRGARVNTAAWCFWVSSRTHTHTDRGSWWALWKLSQQYFSIPLFSPPGRNCSHF